VLNPRTKSDFRKYCVIAENAPFHSAYSLETLRFIPRICRKRMIPLLFWIHGILLKAHSFTSHFLQQRNREAWLRFFTENAQNDPKTHSYEDNAKFNSAFSVTILSHASGFRWKQCVIENFEYLGEFEEYFRKCWLYCILYLLVTERCKKKLKNKWWKSHACVPLNNDQCCLIC
jgi:hypothetical protein